MSTKQIYLAQYWIVILFILYSFSTQIKAQDNSNFYYQIGWQFDFPINLNFSNCMNDIGMYLDAGHYLTPYLSLGAFANINTMYNHLSFCPISESFSTIKNQKFSYIQVPFGISFHYDFLCNKLFRPFISFKTGANYTEIKYPHPLRIYSEHSWGAYISPEIGIRLFPFKKKI